MRYREDMHMRLGLTRRAFFPRLAAAAAMAYTLLGANETLPQEQIAMLGQGNSTWITVEDLAGSDSQYLAIDFLRMRCKILDTGTPANNFDGDPNSKLTYTSPSTKYIQLADGSWAGATTLRLEYEDGSPVGVRMETSATNLILRSQEFDNAAWNKTNVTVTADSLAAPDGTTTADTLTATAANAYVDQSGASTTQQIRAYSVFLKRKTGTGAITIEVGRTSVTCAVETSRWLRFEVRDTSLNGTYSRDGSGTITVTATGHGLNVGDQVRVDITSGTATDASATVATAADANTFTFAQAGASTSGNCTLYASVGRIKIATNGDAVYAWQGQLETFVNNTGAASSPIVTTSAQVTRAADDITLATSAFPFSATAGSVLIRWRALRIGFVGSNNIAEISDGTANERLTFRYNTAGVPILQVIDGGASQAAAGGNGAAVALTPIWYGARWAANDFAWVQQGAAVTTDTSGTLPTVTKLYFGLSAATEKNAMHMSHLLYVPRTMDDTELKSRTGLR